MKPSTAPKIGSGRRFEEHDYRSSNIDRSDRRNIEPFDEDSNRWRPKNPI